jgi:hypothetical protein
MSMKHDDLDHLLDPARLAALWSKPLARPTAMPAVSDAPAAAAPVALRLVASDGAASPEHAQPQPPAPIDVHAHLRELVRAIEDELGAHFDPASPPRRALNMHLELLRTRLASAWPAGTAPVATTAAAAADVLALLDQIEDLLEALLRAGPWNA